MTLATAVGHEAQWPAGRMNQQKITTNRQYPNSIFAQNIAVLLSLPDGSTRADSVCRTVCVDHAVYRVGAHQCVTPRRDGCFPLGKLEPVAPTLSAL
jgi:hypothetical protein